MTITDRAHAVSRAKQAMALLDNNPQTRRTQLAAARDRLNDVCRLTGAKDVWDSVQGLECIVLDVFDTN